jgi:hypothetical protein
MRWQRTIGVLPISSSTTRAERLWLLPRPPARQAGRSQARFGAGARK